MAPDLPLTVIEEVLHWLDRPACPWSCFARLSLSKAPEREALESAARLVIRRHPLLRARLVPGRRAPAFRIGDDDAPDVTWLSGPVGGPLPALPPIDLARENGVRFAVVEGDGAADLVVQWHHVCCDALGILAAVHDLLAAWDHAASGAPGEPDLPRLEPERLRDRGVRVPGLGGFLRLARGQLVGLHGVRKFLAREPVPLVPRSPAPPDGPLPPGYPALHGTVLPAGETRALREAAIARGVTLHELLTRDLFLGLGDFRKRAAPGEEDRWLRLMVPVSLRWTDSLRLPACNLLSCVFLDRRGRDLLDEEALLDGLHEELDEIRRLDLRLTFLLSAGLARFLPGGLERQVRADRSRVSAIFTNAGRLFPGSRLAGEDGFLVAGGATVREVELVPPLQPREAATFCASVYAGRLRLTLHRDSRVIGPGEGEALLAAVRLRLARSAGVA